jgi:hypothetical protein
MVMKEPTGTPCRECPWRRKAAPGWLGPHTAEEWASMAHGEGFIACHLTIKDENDPAAMTQCSGSAIFRGNVCKLPRSGAATLPSDRTTVFSSNAEFVAHHDRKKKS